jgi:molybdate transport system ATP-binding protein
VLRDTGVPALLVTHDFAEAALLGDRVGVLDGGAIVQLGPAAELSARPASAFVADFTGAVVLTGVASPGRDGLTSVLLDGGGSIVSTDVLSGPVGASLYPWEIVLEAGSAPSSAQNHLAAEVVSVTEIGGRARVALQAGQPLVAEVSVVAVRDLRLAPGALVTATWKAAATRLAPR